MVWCGVVWCGVVWCSLRWLWAFASSTIDQPRAAPHAARLCYRMLCRPALKVVYMPPPPMVACVAQALRHPCVCALLGVCMFDSRPSMVLEYMTGGSLHDLLHNSAERTVRDHFAALISRIVAEVASGVAYLHSNGVMHRDVKTANVLLDDARHAKVTDFGISTRFGRPDYTAETGTYRQMAPEVILHKPYNYKCDVYSYGVLLWESTHRQVPQRRGLRWRGGSEGREPLRV